MTSRVRLHVATRSLCVAPARVDVLEARRMFAAVGNNDGAIASPSQGPLLADAAERPSVSYTTPRAGTTRVDRGVDVIAYLKPNNGGIIDDPAALADSVHLYKADDPTRRAVPASVNTTGGGDAIILTPATPLAPDTRYRFDITAGVKGESGAAFQPFSMTFTTGPKGGPTDNLGIEFDKVPLPTATERRFTGVTIGPDGRLYAGTMNGEIVRFDIAGDGTLGVPTVIGAVRDNNAGANRIITGLRFDPASTASDLALWVTHGHGAELQAVEWTGSISRLSGPDLATYRDLVTGLPRSVRDHLTQQMDFDREGALYVSQGSNTAMGAPDSAWGGRAEQMLAGAILKVDVAALLARAGPLDVKTADGGTYDPYAPGAPVTLYATGVRNAFDLLWHSNGHLYAPTNGSAPGGNTPAGGGAPGLEDVMQNGPDFLYRIEPGRYYGHPNPTRGEFVLNGGNPTAGGDTSEILDYPVGTRPDPNWTPPIFEFGDNKSPNGVIEYKSDAFGGILKGRLIVCEYSGGNDLVVLKPDAAGNIPTGNVSRGMAGTTGLVDPLDLVEHEGTGNLYVVEYGARKITLLRPRPLPPAPVAPARAVFNDPVGGAASPVRKLTLRNVGGSAITLAGLGITGPDASMFQLVNAPALPLSVAAGGSVQVSVIFHPPAGAEIGVKTATLRATSPDGGTSHEVALRGLATLGETGAFEPSLQRVMDLFDIRVNVGDADPSTGVMTLPLAEPNDALDVQTLVKAGDGPVTVEPLAVFASASSPTIRFGYYDPANGARSEILTIEDSQRTKPPLTGSVSFDPGSDPFGLFASAPAFTDRTAYSEDARNTWEPVVADRRKALFFPMRFADGTAEPDAFVVAFEEVSGSYDYQDFVTVVRNVKPDRPPVPAPDLTVLLDGEVIAGGVAVNFGDVVEGGSAPSRTLTLRNDGNGDLFVRSVGVPDGFVTADGVVPATLAPGETRSLRIELATGAAGSFAGQIAISTNDPDEATLALHLTGSVTPAPRPAVEVTKVSGAPPIVVPGTRSARFTLKVVVRNGGDTEFAGPATIYASAVDTGQGGTGRDLGRIDKSFTLKPGASKTMKLRASVPAGVSEGDKRLSITIEAGGLTSANDWGGFQVKAADVRLDGPDAVPDVGTRPAGATVRVDAPLKNVGSAPALKMTFALFVATEADAGKPIRHAGVIRRVSIEPGETSMQAVDVSLPPRLSPGRYVIVVRLGAELVPLLRFGLA